MRNISLAVGEKRDRDVVGLCLVRCTVVMLFGFV